LTAETEYEWQVRIRCSNDYWSEWSYSDTFTTKALSCSAPSSAQLATTSITSNSARLQTSIGGNQYKWQYKNQIDTSYTTFTTDANVHDLTNLIHSSRHIWQCKRQCPNEIWSNWSAPITFITESISNPSIVVTEPTENSNHTQGEQLTIRWTSQPNSGNVELRLFKDGQEIWQFTNNTSNDEEHTVTIPNSMTIPSGDGYQVEVKSKVSPFTSDLSKVFSIGDINKSITVTNPNSSSVFSKGEQYIYTWETTGDVGNVRVELFKNNVLVHTHTTNTFNDEEHGFLIPNSMIPGSDYTVKISENQDNIFGLSQVFTIEGPGTVTDPEIIFINPNSSNGFQKFNTGESIQIQWTDNIPDRLILNMYAEGSSTPIEINSNIPDGTQTYSYTIPNDIPDGRYKFRLAYNVLGSTVLGVNSEYIAIGDVPLNISSSDSENQRSQNQAPSYEILHTPNGQSILLEGDYSNTTIELLDEFGQKISNYDNQQSSILITTENLSIGNYFLKIYHALHPSLSLKINLN